MIRKDRKLATIKYVKAMKFLLRCGEGVGVKFYSYNGGNRLTELETRKAINSHLKRLGIK